MSKSLWGDQPTQYFSMLSPDLILQSIDRLGFKTTGRCLTLNSMENRVFELEIEVDESKIKSISEKFIIAKFYRPGRWNKQQIQEEHDFLWDLKHQEIPVIAPLKIANQTLFFDEATQLFYCIFPKQGGRIIDEYHEQHLLQLGRLLARLHQVGQNKNATHRLSLDIETYGLQNLNYLMNNHILPPYLEKSYHQTALDIFKLATPLFKHIQLQRIHGDCHLGNILFKEQQAFLIDFDDMVVGPCMQDLWLVVPGNDQESRVNREILLEGYESMKNFNRQELKIIEVLRALRYLHFSAWIAKRWQDPAFPRAFAHFGSDQYWKSQLEDLINQRDLIAQVNTATLV